MIMEIKMNNSLTADKLGCSVEDLQKIKQQRQRCDYFVTCCGSVRERT